MTSETNTGKRFVDLVRRSDASKPRPADMSPTVDAAEPDVLQLTMGDVDPDAPQPYSSRTEGPIGDNAMDQSPTDWTPTVGDDDGGNGRDDERDIRDSDLSAVLVWLRQRRVFWQVLPEDNARAHAAFGWGIGVPVLLLCTLVSGVIATFVVIGYELTGPALLLLPTVGSAMGYTVVLLHSVFALGQVPLMIFTGIRRDPFFPEIGLTLSAVSGLALVFLLAGEHITAQTPAGTRIYIGLLVLQLLFAPYLVWSRRINVTYKHRIRSREPGSIPMEPKLAASTTAPAPAARADVMSFVKQCPRCGELIRRAATDCRHCGFHYTAELLEKERRMFAGG